MGRWFGAQGLSGHSGPLWDALLPLPSFRPCCYTCRWAAPVPLKHTPALFNQRCGSGGAQVAWWEGFSSELNFPLSQGDMDLGTTSSAGWVSILLVIELCGLCFDFVPLLNSVWGSVKTGCLKCNGEDDYETANSGSDGYADTEQNALFPWSLGALVCWLRNLFLGNHFCSSVWLIFTYIYLFLHL